MSSAHQLRRQADVERLHALAAVSGGRLVVLEAQPTGGSPIRIELHCRTAVSPQYPASAGERVRLRINLPARYPFERPVVTVESPIFHPNVFSSGVVCQGDRWIASEGLDLLVRRMVRLVTFDRAHVNPRSAANGAAATWYLGQVARTPGAFPTDHLALPEPGAAPDRSAQARVSGATGQPAGERVLRQCPHCGKGLRLPAGRAGTVACPGCRHEFPMQT